MWPRWAASAMKAARCSGLISTVVRIPQKSNMHMHLVGVYPDSRVVIYPPVVLLGYSGRKVAKRVWEQNRNQGYYRCGLNLTFCSPADQSLFLTTLLHCSSIRHEIVE